MKKSLKNLIVSEHLNNWEQGKTFLPPYQSGIRWDQKKQIAYVKAILQNCITPPLYIAKGGELVEGQQRTKALELASQFKLGFSKEQIQELLTKKLDYFLLTDYTENELRQFYIAINNSGVAHNKLEIAKASLSEDDSQGFAELESHPLWEKLPIQDDREKRKGVLMQALLLIHSDECSVDIGTASQEKILLDVAGNTKKYVTSLTNLANAVDYVDQAILHKQKWLKRGMIPFILSLAVEAREEGDHPAVFGGFCQQFWLGQYTVMTGKRKNVPISSSEKWSDMTKGSGTSKPKAVQERWNVLFETYSKNIGICKEYEVPEYIKKAQAQAEKKKEQEKNRQLYNEFKAWKEAQGIEE